MSDLKISEFRERAEGGIALPDLAALERRGRARRQRRMVAAVGGLALTLAAGFGVVRVLSAEEAVTPTPVTPPTPTPTLTIDDNGIRTTPSLGEDVLVAGRQSVTYGGVTVEFHVPGENWEWFGPPGLALRESADAPDEYEAAVFFLPEPSARLEPCRADRVRTLGTDSANPLANVAPLLDLAGTTVLQQPRVVSAFGQQVVHLRLRADGGCTDSGPEPSQLQGMFPGEPVGPGWSGTRVLDLWHVVNPGEQPTSMLVASWDLGDDRGRAPGYQALIDSLRIQLG